MASEPRYPSLLDGRPSHKPQFNWQTAHDRRGWFQRIQNRPDWLHRHQWLVDVYCLDVTRDPARQYLFFSEENPITYKAKVAVIRDFLVFVKCAHASQIIPPDKDVEYAFDPGLEEGWNHPQCQQFCVEDLVWLSYPKLGRLLTDAEAAQRWSAQSLDYMVTLANWIYGDSHTLILVERELSRFFREDDLEQSNPMVFEEVGGRIWLLLVHYIGYGL